MRRQPLGRSGLDAGDLGFKAIDAVGDLFAFGFAGCDSAFQPRRAGVELRQIGRLARLLRPIPETGEAISQRQPDKGTGPGGCRQRDEGQRGESGGLLGFCRCSGFRTRLCG